MNDQDQALEIGGGGSIRAAGVVWTLSPPAGVRMGEITRDGVGIGCWAARLLLRRGQMFIQDTDGGWCVFDATTLLVRHHSDGGTGRHPLIPEAAASWPSLCAAPGCKEAVARIMAGTPFCAGHAPADLHPELPIERCAVCDYPARVGRKVDGIAYCDWHDRRHLAAKAA